MLLPINQQSALLNPPPFPNLFPPPSVAQVRYTFLFSLSVQFPFLFLFLSSKFFHLIIPHLLPLPFHTLFSVYTRLSRVPSLYSSFIFSSYYFSLLSSTCLSSFPLPSHPSSLSFLTLSCYSSPISPYSFSHLPPRFPFLISPFPLPPLIFLPPPHLPVFPLAPLPPDVARNSGCLGKSWHFRAVPPKILHCLGLWLITWLIVWLMGCSQGGFKVGQCGSVWLIVWLKSDSEDGF